MERKLKADWYTLFIYTDGMHTKLSCFEKTDLSIRSVRNVNVTTRNTHE